MRSVSFGLALGFLALTVGACGGDEVKPQPVTPVAPVEPPAPPPVVEAPKEEPKPAPTMAELQKKTSEGLGQAMNAHDAKKVASFYGENAVIKMAGMPDVVGREAIAAMWQKNFDMSKDSKSGASRVLVKGDVVIVEFSWAGTHTGEMPGVKATEKPIGAQGADVLWFSPDGLIKEQHTYMDMGTIMSQLGVSKQKARAVPTVPAGAPAVVVSMGTPEETKNVETATKMWGAWEKKSEADFLAGVTDDVTWDDLTQPETMKGKASGKKFFGEMVKAFPDLKATTANMWGVGNFVVAEGTLSGTQKGPLFGIKPTSKQVNMHGLDIVEFNKDGKVVRGASYGNGAEMMMQLGLIPQPGAAKDAKGAAAPAKPGAAPAKTDSKPAAAPAKPAAAPAKPAAAPAKK